jgi:hypothetical protein
MFCLLFWAFDKKADFKNSARTSHACLPVQDGRVQQRQMKMTSCDILASATTRRSGASPLPSAQCLIPSIIIITTLSSPALSLVLSAAPIL